MGAWCPCWDFAAGRPILLFRVDLGLPFIRNSFVPCDRTRFKGFAHLD
ncbi:hypothetical protein BTZ20_5414 [Rhodococcus sp. MTM3W5.2]|nr:hypothetical protein BTZ20_5414 [Rhodococcus sp. MTM3W5.2]